MRRPKIKPQLEWNGDFTACGRFMLQTERGYEPGFIRRQVCYSLYVSENWEKGGPPYREVAYTNIDHEDSRRGQKYLAEKYLEQQNAAANSRNA